jgi:hypothetical protein
VKLDELVPNLYSISGFVRVPPTSSYPYQLQWMPGSDGAHNRRLCLRRGPTVYHSMASFGGLAIEENQLLEEIRLQYVVRESRQVPLCLQYYKPFGSFPGPCLGIEIIHFRPVGGTQ